MVATSNPVWQGWQYTQNGVGIDPDYYSQLQNQAAMTALYQNITGQANPNITQSPTVSQTPVIPQPAPLQGQTIPTATIQPTITGAIAQPTTTAQAAQQPAPITNQYLNQMGQMMQPGNQFTTSDPSYQWRYQQGLDALQRQLAQGGMNYSGGALTAAQQYGQGAASQEYQAQFNRLGTAAGLQNVVGSQQQQAQQFAQSQAQQLQEFGVSSGLTSRSLDLQQQQQQYLNNLQQQQAQMAGLAGLWQGVSGGQGIPGAISGIGQIGSSISSGLSSLSGLLGGGTQTNLSGISGVTSGSAQDIGLSSQVAGTGFDMSSIFG